MNDARDDALAHDAAARSLRHGAQFPYDSPDAWWHDVPPPPPAPARDWAHAAARGILADLTDRRGVKRGFDGVGEDVRAEMVEAIAAIIRTAREQAP